MTPIVAGLDTIIIPWNQPTHTPRQPQLGDTRTHFGGDPFVVSDTTESAETRPKGLDDSDRIQGDGALGQILGGHPPATSVLPEKNILQSPAPALIMGETMEGAGDADPPAAGNTGLDGAAADGGSVDVVGGDGGEGGVVGEAVPAADAGAEERVAVPADLSAPGV